MPHFHTEPARDLPISVIVVSDTRTLATDQGGRVLAELAIAAGHNVLSREVVPDDVEKIRAALEKAIAAESRVVLLTGGTGLAFRDVTPEAVRPRLTREIEGFGEIFRWLSFQEIGGAAMLSRAFAGAIGSTVVFALPGSASGCRLAMERLILPDLGHIASQLLPPRGESDRLRAEDTARIYKVDGREVRADTPRPALPRATPTGSNRAGGRVSLDSERPSSPPEPPRWHQAVESLGARLDGERVDAPEVLARNAPAMEVLDRAGQRATLLLPDGRRYGLWGFADLQQSGARVLAIRASSPVPEIALLHRWPFRAGTCVADRPLVEGLEQPVREVCDRILGRAPDDRTGTVLAVDRSGVWINRAGRVFRWDGRKESDEGVVASALARLVLRWSEQ